MDSHTLLLNKIIALCMENNILGWPSVLWELGFRVRIIEGDIDDGHSMIRPDIVLVSEQEKLALVIDCKSGANVDIEQDIKYSRLRYESLAKRLNLPTSGYRHAVVYAIDKKHQKRIEEHTSKPLIVVGSRSIHGIGDFVSRQTTSVLKAGIPLKEDSEIPISYPFSLNDSDAYVDAYVLKNVIIYRRMDTKAARAELSRRHVANAILRKTHKAYDQIAPRHRSELKNAIIRSIGRLYDRGEL